MLKNIFLWVLPLLVYVPYVVFSRLIEGDGSVPAWLDWVGLLGSASLVLLNPWIRNIDSTAKRKIILVGLFAAAVILMLILTFAILQTGFSIGP